MAKKLSSDSSLFVVTVALLGVGLVMVWSASSGLAQERYGNAYYFLIRQVVWACLGLVSMVADDGKVVETALGVAERLRDGPPAAIRWTKHALNNWLRMAGPTFDASLAMEFMGFSGPEVQEGLAALKEKRRPKFDPKDPF